MLSGKGNGSRQIRRGLLRNSSMIKKTGYWKRHQTFKTLGWASLLGGVGCICSAFALDNQDKAMKVLLWGGGGLALASFPLFGLARSNKLKARSLSLQGQSLSSPLQDGSAAFRPGLSLCWNF